jgi:hypothetical protein
MLIILSGFITTITEDSSWIGIYRKIYNKYPNKYFDNLSYIYVSKANKMN